MVNRALVSHRQPNDRRELARQVGVRRAVIHLLEAGDNKTSWSVDGLLGTKNWLENAGLGLAVMGGSVPLLDRIASEWNVSPMAGEDDSTPGYQTKGRRFAIGNTRGLLESTDGETGT